jgi:hypothetical protein
MKDQASDRLPTSPMRVVLLMEPAGWMAERYGAHRMLAIGWQEGGVIYFGRTRR